MLSLCCFVFRTVEELGVDRDVISSELCSFTLWHCFYTELIVFRNWKVIFMHLCVAPLCLWVLIFCLNEYISLFTMHTPKLVTACFTFMFSSNLRIIISIFILYCVSCRSLLSWRAYFNMVAWYWMCNYDDMLVVCKTSLFGLEIGNILCNKAFTFCMHWVKWWNWFFNGWEDVGYCNGQKWDTIVWACYIMLTLHMHSFFSICMFS